MQPKRNGPQGKKSITDEIDKLRQRREYKILGTQAERHRQSYETNNFYATLSLN